MTPAEVLQEFYADWHMWATHGAGPHAVFRKDMALCECLLHWNTKWRAGVVPGHGFTVLDVLQTQMFVADGLHLDYPFNIDRDDFLLENYESTCHTNTRRLAWVAKQVQGDAP